MKTALFFSYNGLYKLILLELMDRVETSFAVKIELAVTLCTVCVKIPTLRVGSCGANIWLIALAL